MKEFLKQPAVIIILIISAFIGGFFIGKSNWFKNLLKGMGGSGGQNLPNGSPCTTDDGKAGTIVNGVCLQGAGGGTPPVDDGSGGSPSTQRTTNGNSVRTASSDVIPASTRNGRIAQLASIGLDTSNPANFPNACEAWIACDWQKDPQGCKTTWKDCEKALSALRTTSTSAPPTILLSASSNCGVYTTSNPYKHLGCSYVFGGYVLDKGERKCLLKKVSCP